MYRMLEFSHQLIKDYYESRPKKDLVYVDATLGRGKDTLFMAKLLKDTGKVFSYDIQSEAISSTKKLLEQENIHNVYLKQKSHEFIEEIPDLVIYNLGYLPDSNKEITTMAKSTLSSVKQMVAEMSIVSSLLLILVIYPGHPEGKLESEALEDFVKNLPIEKYYVTKFQNMNATNSPYVITIQNQRK
jgi:ubiquinone/menaquinone biosynthesis C-methylase UbiE